MVPKGTATFLAFLVQIVSDDLRLKESVDSAKLANPEADAYEIGFDLNHNSFKFRTVQDAVDTIRDGLAFRATSDKAKC